MKNVRVIAFYLPQFHPIPENDEWWGKGFTEWTNVARAKPLYPGHYQPRLPADLGFYDLRLPETRIAQAALAREYGIHGFCYYYYFFSKNKKLLERPVEEMLKSGTPDFPFCLCWANESWSRRWDGQDSDVLVEQDYSLNTCKSLVKELIPFFLDNRYIKVDGKPVLLIYRDDKFDNLAESLATIRQEARDLAHLELYLITHENYGADEKTLQAGFDGIYEFPNGFQYQTKMPSIHAKLNLTESFNGLVRDYNDLAYFYQVKPKKTYRVFKGVTLGWDNTARKKSSAYILENFSLDAYKEWLAFCVSQTQSTGDDNLIFINAWNEWAEGTYLEPDSKNGLKYLQATKEALSANVPTAMKKIWHESFNVKADMVYHPHLWGKEDASKYDGWKNYFDKPRLELFKAIGHPGSLMLDVGCGAGATSAALKKQYPQGKFYGVELNPNIATIASEKLDKVVVGNFEDIDYKAHALKAGSFDTILFADVLEHMYNPWKVLDRTKELLSNGGKVVASIPNISNLQSLDNLARGKWHYDDFGILDFTHIRFFTRKTILEMFAETGYEVLDIYGLPLDDQLNPGFHLDVENNLYTHCLSLKNITKRQLNNLRILQFVVTATPKK